LKNICEIAKKNLSSVKEFVIDIDNLSDGIDFNLPIERGEFESLCEDLFNSCLPYIDNAIKDAKLKKEEIDEIVLVGGSSRIPYIIKMVENYFKDKQIKKNLNADEAVAIGAAYQAKNIEGGEDGLEHLVVIDVSPLSLGIRVKGNKTHVLIPRNTMLPATKTKQFYTTHDYQKIAGIRVFQGENESCKLNFELGSFDVIIKQTDKLAGKVKFDVTFELDVNSILKVTAKEFVEGGKVYEKDNINAKTDRFTEDEIEELIKNAKLLNDADSQQEKAIKAKIYLQKICLEEKNKGNKNADIVINKIKNEKSFNKEKYDKLLEELNKVKK
jgi:molecular chaperone DnaK (HSP70)